MVVNFLRSAIYFFSFLPVVVVTVFSVFLFFLLSFFFFFFFVRFNRDSLDGLLDVWYKSRVWFVETDQEFIKDRA